MKLLFLGKHSVFLQTYYKILINVLSTGSVRTVLSSLFRCARPKDKKRVGMESCDNLTGPWFPSVRETRSVAFLKYVDVPIPAPGDFKRASQLV